MSSDVEEWKNRLRKTRGPFYLLATQTENSRSKYHVVWKERHKHGYDVARAGWFVDGMSARYGVKTYCSLAGSTPFDFSYGTCDPNDFEFIRQVFEDDVADKQEFDLDCIRDLSW